MNQLKKSDLLIIDDFGLSRLDINESRELLEVIEDRYNSKSCIFVSQLPPTSWYETFNDLTFADAIMDRIIHNSYKIEIKGPSMREKTSTLTA
jgi:DNA replication protein DnaC